MQDRTHSLPAQFRHGSLLVRAFVIALLSLAVLSGGALANPPADAVMIYDQNSGDLVITITHPVDDPTTHYVKQVTVTQGDTVLVDKSYTSQPDRSSVTYRYNLPQLKGTGGVINVDAQCSLFGSRSGTLTLSGTPASGTPDSTASATTAPAKSPAGVFAVLLAIGFVARQILK